MGKLLDHTEQVIREAGSLLERRILNLMELRAVEDSRGLQSRLDAQALVLEKTVREFNPNLQILEPTVMLQCPKCTSPIIAPPAKGSAPLDAFDYRNLYQLIDEHREGGGVVFGEVMGQIKCFICGNVFGRKDALRIHIHKVKDSIAKVWNKNVWLEDYVARLLKEVGWQTWSHVNVLGASGLRHEIDVLGVKGSNVLISECKTGQVTRQQVFNFWTKVYDLRSHVSLLALVGKLPEPETREFVTKNPSMALLEGLGEMKRQDIREVLSKSIVGRI